MGSMRTHIQFYPTNWEWRDPRRSGLVEGVGTNDADYATNPCINGNRLACPACRSWCSMLRRCYSKKFHRCHPTYVGTSCIKSWLLFSNFRDWYFQQRDLISHYGYEGPLQLDKDILSDSKTYRPKNCILIPPALNTLLGDCRSVRGKYPIGVTEVKRKFQARVCTNGKRKCKAGFNTPEDAAKWRLKTKLEYVRTFPLPPWLDGAKVRSRLLKIVRGQR